MSKRYTPWLSSLYNHTKLWHHENWMLLCTKLTALLEDYCLLAHNAVNKDDFYNSESGRHNIESEIEDQLREVTLKLDTLEPDWWNDIFKQPEIYLNVSRLTIDSIRTLLSDINKSV